GCGERRLFVQGVDMSPMPYDSDAASPETGEGLEITPENDTDPRQWVDTLDTVLSRPPSWSRRFFLSGVGLLVGVVLVISIVRGVVPAVQSAMIVNTPISFTPTPTLAVAGQITATIPIGAVHEHTFIIASDTAVWVHDGPTGMVTRIDPATNKVVAKI